MDLTCKKCGHHYDGPINRKKNKWDSTCPSCGESWEVKVPTGRIVMAFTDALDKDDPYRYFTNDFTGECIVAYYAFETPSEFIKKWEEIHEKPDGMWYWVLDNSHCICSGACDPNDIDIFRDHWHKILVHPPQCITERTLECARNHIESNIRSAMIIKPSVYAVVLPNTLILRREQSRKGRIGEVGVTYKFVSDWSKKSLNEINVCLAEQKWREGSAKRKSHRVEQVEDGYKVMKFIMTSHRGNWMSCWSPVAHFSDKKDAIYYAESKFTRVR